MGKQQLHEIIRWAREHKLRGETVMTLLDDGYENMHNIRSMTSKDIDKLNVLPAQKVILKRAVLYKLPPPGIYENILKKEEKKLPVIDPEQEKNTKVVPDLSKKERDDANTIKINVRVSTDTPESSSLKIHPTKSGSSSVADLTLLQPNSEPSPHTPTAPPRLRKSPYSFEAYDETTPRRRLLLPRVRRTLPNEPYFYGIPWYEESRRNPRQSSTNQRRQTRRPQTLFQRPTTPENWPSKRPSEDSNLCPTKPDVMLFLWDKTPTEITDIIKKVNDGQSPTIVTRNDPQIDGPYELNENDHEAHFNSVSIPTTLVAAQVMLPNYEFSGPITSETLAEENNQPEAIEDDQSGEVSSLSENVDPKEQIGVPSLFFGEDPRDAALHKLQEHFQLKPKPQPQKVRLSREFSTSEPVYTDRHVTNTEQSPEIKPQQPQTLSALEAIDSLLDALKACEKPKKEKDSKRNSKLGDENDKEVEEILQKTENNTRLSLTPNPYEPLLFVNSPQAEENDGDFTYDVLSALAHYQPEERRQEARRKHIATQDSCTSDSPPPLPPRSRAIQVQAVQPQPRAKTTPLRQRGRLPKSTKRRAPPPPPAPVTVHPLNKRPPPPPPPPSPHQTVPIVIEEIRIVEPEETEKTPSRQPSPKFNLESPQHSKQNSPTAEPENSTFLAPITGLFRSLSNPNLEKEHEQEEKNKKEDTRDAAEKLSEPQRGSVSPKPAATPVQRKKTAATTPAPIPLAANEESDSSSDLTLSTEDADEDDDVDAVPVAAEPKLATPSPQPVVESDEVTEMKNLVGSLENEIAEYYEKKTLLTPELRRLIVDTSSVVSEYNGTDSFKTKSYLLCRSLFKELETSLEEYTKSLDEKEAKSKRKRKVSRAASEEAMIITDDTSEAGDNMIQFFKMSRRANDLGRDADEAKEQVDQLNEMIKHITSSLQAVQETLKDIKRTTANKQLDQNIEAVLERNREKMAEINGGTED